METVEETRANIWNLSINLRADTACTPVAAEEEEEEASTNKWFLL
jgi:hypothetical protein